MQILFQISITIIIYVDDTPVTKTSLSYVDAGGGGGEDTSGPLPSVSHW